jgi:hypothetical protein
VLLLVGHPYVSLLVGSQSGETTLGLLPDHPASAWPEGEHGGVKVNIYFSHTFCMRDHMKVNIQTLNATKCTKVPYI